MKPNASTQFMQSKSMRGIETGSIPSGGGSSSRPAGDQQAVMLAGFGPVIHAAEVLSASHGFVTLPTGQAAPPSFSALQISPIERPQNPHSSSRALSNRKTQPVPLTGVSATLPLT